ncbi:hypothetical protein IV203_037647 [Nitzschia inconspicua]|uniref:Uncharacterized protein n=1 Tax=Nitzschia inconspicua TaxID=303405 RepID=A0A9K3LL50_9STRA|nr:hypothetical protein IV203_037647 [Nitzschia inconspicua]
MTQRQIYRRRSTSSGHQTVIALSMPPFVRLGCLILVVSFFSFTFFAWITHPSPASDGTSIGSDSSSLSHGHLASLRQRLVQDNDITGFGLGSTSSLKRDTVHRLAIIIPFIGQGPSAIPSYLELFCTCAAGSADLVDYLLIHDGILDGFHQSHQSPCPDNVRFISMGSIQEFSQALVRVTDRIPDDEFPKEVGGSREELANILAKFIRKYPYVMVEFKPALGHIFEEHLKGYTHWGYSDLDILFGDLGRWITPDELDEFDIVTYGFGDQERVYLRGQFTFHRNDPEKINQLWRRCEYLSNMDQRFAEVLSGESQIRFESAEGCYSAAVLESTDIKIKYAVKAFTDIEAHDTAYTHGLYVSTGKRKDRTVIYKAGNDNPRGLATISDGWFETRGSYYANSKTLLYKPVGDRERLPMVEKRNANCMYWAQKKYQSKLCVDDVESTDTLYWIDGQLYKEKFELASLPGGLSTAPFFHFQEWKRYYRPSQLAGFRRKGPSSTFVFGKEGVFPILPTRITGSGGVSVLVKSKDRSVVTPSPLGQSLSNWNGVTDDQRQNLPHYRYCLRSKPQKKNSKTPSCVFMSSWRDANTVEVLSGASAWNALDANVEVTLALTLQIHSDQLGDSSAIQGFLNLLTLYLDRWQGQPCVLVLHVAGATAEVANLFRTKFGPASDLSYYGLDNVLAAAIFSQGSETLSRKALMNMAIDASPTRWVLHGFELERGIVFSQDTSFLVHRTAQIHKDFPGAVYVIPQFGLVQGDHDLSVGGLELAHLDGQLKSFSELENANCVEDDDESTVEEAKVFSQMNGLWWEKTRQLIQERPVAIDEKIVEQHAQALDGIQQGLTGLLMEEEHYNLYSTDVSPILLMDNLGPRNGMITNEMVREVDEFGGKLCYNSLKLAQLATLGYHVNVLAGAFAISTPITRSVIGDPSVGPLGVSRCDGCFFYQDEKQEDVLESISLDERLRPAKIAILWEHSGNPLKGHT